MNPKVTMKTETEKSPQTPHIHPPTTWAAVTHHSKVHIPVTLTARHVLHVKPCISSPWMGRSGSAARAAWPPFPWLVVLPGRTDTCNLSGGEECWFGSLPPLCSHDFHKIFYNITLPAMSACVTTSQSLKARGTCWAARSSNSW